MPSRRGEQRKASVSVDQGCPLPVDAPADSRCQAVVAGACGSRRLGGGCEVICCRAVSDIERAHYTTRDWAFGILGMVLFFAIFLSLNAAMKAYLSDMETPAWFSSIARALTVVAAITVIRRRFKVRKR